MKLLTHEVDDCLRYTIVIPTEVYTEGVLMIISRLTCSDLADECAVASNLNAYNFWTEQKGVCTYMGLHAFVTLNPLAEDDDGKSGASISVYDIYDINHNAF